MMAAINSLIVSLIVLNNQLIILPAISRSVMVQTGTIPLFQSRTAPVIRIPVAARVPMFLID